MDHLVGIDDLNILEVKCPEKIIVCLDVSEDMLQYSFRSRAGDKMRQKDLIIRALRFFFAAKHFIDKEHQFALVVISDCVAWLQDFTSDFGRILDLIEEMEWGKTSSSFHFSDLFKVLREHTHLNNDNDIRPACVTRCIFIYGRSHCLPIIACSEIDILDSPYFFFDIIYIHQPPSENDYCEKIFEAFFELHTNFEYGKFYIFETSRFPQRIYDSLAKLIAYPLHRPLQTGCFYRIADEKS